MGIITKLTGALSDQARATVRDWWLGKSEVERVRLYVELAKMNNGLKPLIEESEDGHEQMVELTADMMTVVLPLALHGLMCLEDALDEQQTPT